MSRSQSSIDWHDGAWQCAAAWLVDRTGRRPLLLGSTAGMIGTILLLTLGLELPPSGGASALIAISVIAYVGCFGCGQGPVPPHGSHSAPIATMSRPTAHGLFGIACVPGAVDAPG